MIIMRVLFILELTRRPLGGAPPSARRARRRAYAAVIAAARASTATPVSQHCPAAAQDKVGGKPQPEALQQTLHYSYHCYLIIVI
jgi:hypothetical protein